MIQNAFEAGWPLQLAAWPRSLLSCRAMNFTTLRDQFDWVPFSGQMDSGVTYAFVLNRTVERLIGKSDILYIGKTEQAIRVRYEQETRTKNSPRNTQQTNIRTTFVFSKIGLENVECYYVKALTTVLSGRFCDEFLEGLRTWDKKSFLAVSEHPRSPGLEVSLEKYLLVRYVSEHLEVPPLNNRM